MVVATTADDDNFGTFPIGFTFQFNGNNYTTFGLNANGFITMGYVPVTTNNALSSGVNNNVIAGFNNDLYGVASGAQISYQTSGTGTSHVLTAEWSNWGFFNSGGGNEFNFQIKLFESTNKIDIVYGSCPGNASATLQIGLRGQSNADFNNRTTTTNWAATTAGAANNANCTYNSSLKPSSGLTFEWTPTPAARVCGTITSVQQTGTAAPGSTNNTILRVDIPVTGNIGTLTLSSITVISKNTADNDIMTSGVKAWIGTSSGPVTQVGSGVNFSGGNANLTSLNSALITGTNYVWITFDVKTTATVGNVLDAKINSGGITITASGGATSPGTQPAANLNPNGSKTVNYCTPFSTNGGCDGDKISAFSYAGINYSGSCVSSPGYNDVGTVGSAYQGQSNNFTLTLEDVNDYAAIWIDFNDNASFEDAGEQVYSGGPGTSLTGSIYVPVSVAAGTHRLRVRDNYGSVPPSSCGSITFGETKDFRLTVIAATNCSGAPAASNTLSTSNPVCSGVNFTLSLSVTYLNLGITYQWQSSSNGSTYNNISGATSYSYTTTQSNATYYRCQITCTNSGQSINSTALQVNQNSFTNCYCTPATGDCSDDKINSVVFAGISNSSTCSSGGYGNFTGQTGTTSQGTVQSISVGVSSGGTEYVSVWIDYNHNAVYEESERKFVGSGIGQTLSSTILIPSNALTGGTRMRVRLQFAFEPTDPCAAIEFGETEDYSVNINSCTQSTFYADADGDGYGNPGSSQMFCAAPSGYVANNTDCNDASTSVHPNATEACNNIDDDCDNQVDEGLTQYTYYVDGDNDTYGNSSSSISTCQSSAPSGYSVSNTDCNDANSAIHPNATETCNGIDDDCDNQTDEGVKTTFYADADGDSYGNINSTTQACSVPSGYVTNSTDCNDANAAVHPNATEVCNSVDDDCDNQTDEEVKLTFYADADGDTYGNLNSTTLACSAPSGYVSNSTDCNDANAAIHPNATETCNGIDDDCDNQTDEGVKITFYADADGDTYGNTNSTTLACSAPSGYVSNNTDCNDANAAIHPNATEVCNAVDDNCDGQVDEGVKTTFYADADNDAYGNPNSTTQACSLPSGYVTNSTDCNDANATIHPNATETCNGVDDDCDNQVDEGVKLTFYADADGDSYGNINSTILACTPPSGYVSNSTDCNDGNAAVHPNATELCNSIDEDCDNQVDEGVQSTFYADADGDGYGNSTVSAQACSAPSGYVSNSTDCNDNNNDIHPGAPEQCNAADDNCNGQIDDGVVFLNYYLDIDNDGYGTTLLGSLCIAPPNTALVPGDCNDANAAVHPNAPEVCNNVDDDCDSQVDEGVKITFYADADGDTYGNPNSTTEACTVPSGYVSSNTDCNDANSSVHPNAAETCNGVDDNCDGQVDEGVKITFYADADGDTYGNPNSTTQACSAPSGYVSNNTDCNDANAAIHPNATEVCNNIDDDCDNQTDEGVKITFYADADGDTYGNPNSTTQACSVPSGYVSNNTDCNDANSAIHPNATEVCNSVDDDCDNQTDEGVKITFYADADGDIYGNPSSTTLACTAPSGYVSNNTDCNDGNAAVHPNATEVCNSIDDNCNTQVDEGVKITFYADADGDTYGNPSSTTLACTAPSGYVINNTDCNDGNAAVRPNATEICNGIDDNCNSQTDEGVKSTFYADADLDTYGNPASTTQACSAPSGYVSNNTDCNDANAAVHPGVSDVCNGIDDNCNGSTDENGIVATISPGGSVSACKGTTITLTANAGTGLTYQWLKGSSNIAGATKQTYSPTKTASYSVKETNTSGCSATSSATSVTVLAQPTATITVQGNLDICQTGSVVLQANAGSGYQYKWLKGGATISGATNQNYTATATGTYKVIVTASNGCSKTSGGKKVTKSCKEDVVQLLLSSFTLYPNPSDGWFMVELELQNNFSGTASLVVANTLGQNIFKQEIPVTGGRLTEKLYLGKEISAGMYVVKVIVDNEVFTAQMVINK